MSGFEFWGLLWPFLIKSVIAAVGLGLIGGLVGKFFCYHDKDDEKDPYVVS